MNFYFKRFLLLVFCLIGSVSYAQITVTNGYFISNDNDTVYGRLEKSNTGYYNRCVFVKNNSSAIEYLKPDQVKKFHVAPDIFFNVVECNGKKKFLKLLSTGKINLFYDEKSLYVSDKMNNPTMLLGGEKLITIDGNECFKYDESYKTQIMIVNPDSGYYDRIQELKFQRRQIYKLINDINGDSKMSDIGDKQGKVFNHIHFGIEAGITINTFNLQNLYYDYEGYYIYRPESFKFCANGIYAGVNFKLKMAETNSYFSVGLNVEKVKENKEEHGLVQSQTVTFEANRTYRDTLGYIKDAFTLDLKSVSIPVYFHFEKLYSRFRPFYDLGITYKYFFRNECFLNRDISLTGGQNVERSYKLVLPANMGGANIGLGCRYLIDMNSSISVGYNIGYMIIGRELESNMKGYIINRIFLSFNF